MKEFEYKTIGFHDLKKDFCQEFDKDKLNKLGKEGWELVSVLSSGECVFKREISNQLVRSHGTAKRNLSPFKGFRQKRKNHQRKE